jgi:hypothetical protein
MNRSTSLPIVAMSVFALAGGAMAQMRGPFPQPGDPMPDVAGFDAEGNPLALTKLHGKHAVIVFGCLT